MPKPFRLAPILQTDAPPISPNSPRHPSSSLFRPQPLPAESCRSHPTHPPPARRSLFRSIPPISTSPHSRSPALQPTRRSPSTSPTPPPPSISSKNCAKLVSYYSVHTLLDNSLPAETTQIHLWFLFIAP